MADETLAQVAQAVAAEINRRIVVFGETCAAVVQWVPDYEVADADPSQAVVLVVPKARKASLVDRARNEYEYTIDVGVLKRIGDVEDVPGGVAPMLDLCDALHAYLIRRTLTDAPGAKWRSIGNDPIYDPATLNTKKTFLSIITLTYTVTR